MKIEERIAERLFSNIVKTTELISALKSGNVCVTTACVEVFEGSQILIANQNMGDVAAVLLNQIRARDAEIERLNHSIYIMEVDQMRGGGT